MSETKDPAIKLFGKTIPLPDNSHGGTTTTAMTCSGAAESVVVDVDSQDQDQDQDQDSYLEDSNTKGDGEERESDKVMICFYLNFFFPAFHIVLG